MKTEKSCNNCIYSIPDWTNVCNPDHYCSNEESEEYGYNVEYLNGCDKWKSIEQNLGNNGSICTKTRVNDEDRTTDDCISRKMAIETVSNMFAVTATQKDMVEDCLEILKNLPSLKFATDINVGCTIYRKAAIDTLTRLEPSFRGSVLEQALKNMPSIQPEIIRCKDCKYWLDIDDGRQKHRMCADIYGDWFCADAERRRDV